MEKKKQHIIPQCYQRAWCDPNTPEKQEPFIWIISRDGKIIRPKAPRNIFTENDAYTVKSADGSRNLIVEDTLAGIEGAFSKLRDTIGIRALDDKERAVVCLFTAAMFSRTLDQRENWRDNFTRLRDMTKAVEDAYDTNHSLSNAADVLLNHAHPYSISLTLDSMPHLLLGMTMTVLETNDEIGFITSDTPCMLMNPDAHKWPPLFRTPGLAHPKTELIMPISPRFCLGFSHYYWLNPVISIPMEKLDEMNRTTRRHSREFIVSKSKDPKPHWFKEYELPPDTWENTHQPDDMQINPLLGIEESELPFDRAGKPRKKN